MDSHLISVGAEYAYRKWGGGSMSLDRVTVLQKVRGQWRVKWVEPNAGLIDFVRSRELVVPWQEHRAFLRDERNHELLIAASRRTWPGRDNPLTVAVDTVLLSAGEHFETERYGEVVTVPDSLERVVRRAKLTDWEPSTSYVDRAGMSHIDFRAALQLAKAFAAAEPATVILRVETEERQYTARVREPGESYLLDRVEEWRSAWALCREWAGVNSALAEKDHEIERLRRILDDVRWEARRQGLDELARKIEWKLKGR
jgi:hypothetical protein